MMNQGIWKCFPVHSSFPYRKLWPRGGWTLSVPDRQGQISGWSIVLGLDSSSSRRDSRWMPEVALMLPGRDGGGVQAQFPWVTSRGSGLYCAGGTLLAAWAGRLDSLPSSASDLSHGQWGFISQYFFSHLQNRKDSPYTCMNVVGFQ